MAAVSCPTTRALIDRENYIAIAFPIICGKGIADIRRIACYDPVFGVFLIYRFNSFVLYSNFITLDFFSLYGVK